MAHRSAFGSIIRGPATGSGVVGTFTQRLDLACRYCQPADSDAAARTTWLSVSRNGTGSTRRPGWCGGEFREGHGIGSRGLRRVHTDGEVALDAKAPRRSRSAVSTGTRLRPEFVGCVERPRIHRKATESAG